MEVTGYLAALCVLGAAWAGTARQTEQAIQEVEKYIADKSSQINPRYRPHYHVAPPVGWMNDPNGFSYFNGEYHLFYQFYPYKSEWGPMHWGHSSSSNLVDWKTLPTALVPDEEQCFSGSGIVVNDTLVLMYTGHVPTESPTNYTESQYLAFSTDGVKFTKYEANPVLPAAPNGSPDFRDPKVWKHGDYWYVVLGSKTDDLQRGRVLLYRSANLYDWEFLSILGETGVTGDLGYMWECPDFFELDGRFVLLWSPQGMEPQGDRYKNLYQVGYILGDFSYETYQFVNLTGFQEIDYGHDFYASQTVENNGKRYLVAWLNSWEKVYPEAEDGWVSTLTIIREISIVGDRVLMKPIDDMTILRENVIIQGTLEPEQEIEFEQTGEIIIENLNLTKYIEIQIQGRNGGDLVKITWDPDTGKVAVDRSGDVRQVEWSPIGSHSWRLFLDASSMELFCGEGEVVFSSRAYPDGDWILKNLSEEGISMVAYKLRRSVPATPEPEPSSSARVAPALLPAVLSMGLSVN